MDFMDCCRLCLKDLSIFPESGEPEEIFIFDDNIRKQCTECFQILLTDLDTSSKICEGCYNDMQFVLKIRKRVHDADAMIRNYQSNQAKKEENTVVEANSDGYLSENEYSIEVQDSCTDDTQGYQLMKVEKVYSVETPNLEPNRSSSESPNEKKLNTNPVTKDVKKPFTCYICTTHFDNRDELDIHLPSHVGTVKPICNLCKMELTTIRHLNIHLQRTHFTTGQRIPCEECQKEGVTREFSSKTTLQAHINSAHLGIVKEQERNHVCSYCGKNFFRASYLKLHENIHTNSVTFKCKLCQFVGKTRSALLRHERTHTLEKPFKCDMCDAKFAQSNGLQFHKHCRHNDERPFPCNICGDDVRFKSKYTLATHLKTHESRNNPGRQNDLPYVPTLPGEPTHKCQFCPALYAKELFLCRHLLLKHKEEAKNIPMLQCEICAKDDRNLNFLTQREKDLHLAYHKKVSKKVFKKSPCEFCGKLVRGDAMSKHRKLHLGGPINAKCALCSKSYKSRKELRRHFLTLHCNSRPYKCDKCDEAYGQLIQLQIHLDKHHKNLIEKR